MQHIHIIPSGRAARAARIAIRNRSVSVARNIHPLVEYWAEELRLALVAHAVNSRGVMAYMEGGR